MTRKKKTDVKSPFQSALDIMSRQATKDRIPGAKFVTVAQAATDYHWIDFCDPLFNTPCLLLEYLWGARGMLTGRILKIEAPEGAGKSSYTWLQYAMAQRTSSAWCMHAESEGALPPPDFIASFGCDPNAIFEVRPEERSIEGCINRIDWMTNEIRRPAKGVDDNVIDPEMRAPIVVGIDSISGYGTRDSVEMDVGDGAAGGLGVHSRVMGKFFRDRWSVQEDRQVFLLVVAQQREKIDTGPKFPGSAPVSAADKLTTIANRPLNYSASYRLEIKASPLKDKETYQQYGETVTLKVLKNKLSPKGKSAQIQLIWNHGFDLLGATFDLLKVLSPIALPDGSQFDIVVKGQWVDCKALDISNSKLAGSKDVLSTRDIILKLYDNKAVLMKLREALRIRGFGFKFETNYQMTQAEIEDNTQTEDEAAGGLTPMVVQDAAPQPATGAAGG